MAEGTILNNNKLYPLSLVLIGVMATSFFCYKEYEKEPQQHSKSAAGFPFIHMAYSWYLYGVSNFPVQTAKIKQKEYTLYSNELENIQKKRNPFTINEALGYPLLVYGIWKITGSPNLLYPKILNIILFGLFSVFLFQVVLLFVKNPLMAWWCSLGVVLFPPLIGTAIVWNREIFQYFGIILFLYCFLLYVKENNKISFLIVGSVVCVLLQWVRPSLFATFCILSLVGLCWPLLETVSWKKIKTFLMIFWIINIFLFWIPFCSFNKLTYGTYFMAPIGEMKLSRLLGPSFPDGFHFPLFGHAHIPAKMMKAGELKAQNFDDACLEYYYQLKEKYPYQEYKAFMYRLIMILVQDIDWRVPRMVTVNQPMKIKQILQYTLSNPIFLIELFFRFIVHFIRIIGFLGILLAFSRRQYMLLLFFIIGVMYSSGYILLSHIESRILAVHVWPLAFFAQYFLAFCAQSIRSYCLSKKYVYSTLST